MSEESQESSVFVTKLPMKSGFAEITEIGDESFPWCYGASFQFQEGLNEIVEKRSSCPLILTS